MIKITLATLALAVAALAAGNAYAKAVPQRLTLVTSDTAPRIKVAPRNKLGCNEISKTIVVNGIPYTATKCN